MGSPEGYGVTANGDAVANGVNGIHRLSSSSTQDSTPRVNGAKHSIGLLEPIAIIGLSCKPTGDGSHSRAF